MKLLLLLTSIVLFTGCDVWIERREPTTPEERKAVQEAVDRQVAALRVQRLGGHDQDWDDTITAINIEVRKNLCRPTYWQIANGGHPTGRFRYAQETQ